jgi:DMSO/TMAO reductase YedYZ molybdopterin-dependent catalytic subunit
MSDADADAASPAASAGDGEGRATPVRGGGDRREPAPLAPSMWRSPLRGPWLTAVFGAVLLVGVSVVFATGLLSYASYNPDLRPNDFTPRKGVLGFYLFDWPTHPAWLYRFTQGLHVALGLVLVPVLLAKLWSVIPKLFVWPPARSVAQLLERLSLFLLVGGAVFEFATGILNIQLFYAFHFSFYTAHFYGAWVFMSAFVVHAALKFRRMRASLRARPLREVLRTPTSRTLPEPPDPDGLVAANPAPASISRRGALGFVGAGSLLLATTAGQSLGGPFRALALLAPHGRDLGSSPNDFQVNKTAANRGIDPAATGPAWRLVLDGPTPRRLSRADLLALPQHTARLPIACVEGWSTTQTWQGVRLADLAGLAGLPRPAAVLVESLETGGDFRHASLRGNQVLDPRSLLALRVNGADLSLDHGFPARVIVPAAPGVHNTKWVTTLTFAGEP